MQFANLLVGQVGKHLGEKWKGLSDKQKAPYEAKAAQDKKRYEEEKANYQVSNLIVVVCCSANKSTLGRC